MLLSVRILSGSVNLIIDSEPCSIKEVHSEKINLEKDLISHILLSCPEFD